MKSPDIDSTRRGGKWPSMAALLAMLLLGLAVLLMAGAGPAYRQELLSLGSAFSMLRYGGYAAIGAAALGLIALIAGSGYRRLRPALIGAGVIVFTAAMLAVPWLHWQRAQEAPPIHDITTDTQNPPAFEALAGAREQAPNAVEYPGEETAQQQREAYPEIQPLILQASMPSVVEAAQREVLDAGWQLVALTTARSDDRLESRIEAIATTRWFGFQDDIVIRLRETDEGVRVDMRSASRMGRGDTGTNAARIRDYLAELERSVT